MTKPVIPAAALEQHIAVLGKNGSGKTYATKAVIVEPLLESGKHVAIVDPTSAWWGLRSSASGKGPGFKVVVLGGDHGDLPLPALGGAAVARLIIEQRVNAVIDTGSLSVGERTRWMVDFAGTVYRLNRTPLYLVLDEAHVFAPQGGGGRVDVDANKMLHNVNQLASGGRSRGIRLTMLTQRPQKLHKDTLTTADTLIAMRVLAPHDRAAVKAWIDGCGEPSQGREVLDSLAQLQRGEGWIWYPEGAHLMRTKFPAIKTFDSSATPTEGSALQAPKGAAEIDLTEIRVALADAVKEAEANDPKLLRAEIARLKGESANAPSAERLKGLEADNVKLRKMHQEALQYASAQLSEDVIDAQHRGRREGFVNALHKVREVAKGLDGWADLIQRPIRTFNEDLEKEIVAAESELDKVIAKRSANAAAPKAPPQGPADRAGARIARTPAAAAAARGHVSADVSGPQQRILDALAWLEAVGIEDAHRTQLALLAKASPTSSSYQNNLGHLRNQLTLIAYRGDSRIFLTDAGRAAAQAPATPPTTGDLHRTLQVELSGPQWRILEQLIKRYPDAIDKTTLADLAGASVSSSSYQNNLGALRSLGFVDYPERGDVVALPVLFLER